jgi:hypothetical protein
MGRGSTTLLLAFVLAGLATAAAVWLRQEPPPPSPSPSPPVAPPPTPQATSPQGPTTQEPANALPDSAPRVWIEMETLGSYVKVPSVLVRENRDSWGLTRGGDLEAPDARVDLAILGGSAARGGTALVQLYDRERANYRRVRPTDDGSAWDPRDRGMALKCRVLAPDRTPVAGALVWIGDEKPQPVTGENGEVELFSHGGVGVPIVVRAPGYAWQHRFVDLLWDLRPAAPETQEFVLSPESVLTVHWIGTADQLRDARVVLLPAGETFTTELLAYPFFAQTVLEECRFDAQGQAVVRGLPLGATIGVSARGPCVPVTPPQKVELRRATASAQIGSTARVCAAVRGTVVDADGKPLPGATVCCWALGQEPTTTAADRWLLARVDQLVGATVTTSDADGAFELLPPNAAQFVVAVSAGVVELRRTLARGATGPLRCPLPVWTAAPAQLRVPPPVQGVPWGVRVEPPDREFTAVAADQPFARALSAPVLATLRVRCRRSGGDWSAPRVAAEVAVIGDWELPAALLAR